MAEAARSLDLTTAAVAHQIKALEKELDAALVARSGRTVMPTPAGYLLLEKIAPLMVSLSELRASVHNPGMEGHLRLGVINSVLHALLPEVLQRYSGRYPNVRVHVHGGLSDQLFQQLQEDAVDAAICLHPPFSLPKSFEWQALKREPLVVLASKRVGHVPPLRLLRTRPFIRYDRRLGGGKLAEVYLRAHGISPREVLELDSLLTIALMVHKQMGVALVPSFSSPLTKGLDIVALALDDAPEARTVGMLWKRASVRISLIRAALDEARIILEEMPP